MTAGTRNHTSDTRNKLVREAANMSQSIGYEALSLQDLADELGIRKASIFHHFSSKDDLAVAVIESDIHTFHFFVKNHEAQDAAQRLSKYFDFYRDLLKNGRVCPASAFAISWPNLSTRVQSALVRLHKEHFAFLEDVIHDGVSAGQFHLVANISDIVHGLPDMLQGAVQVARASGNAIPINRLERLTLKLLGC